MTNHDTPKDSTAHETTTDTASNQSDNENLTAEIAADIYRIIAARQLAERYRLQNQLIRLVELSPNLSLTLNHLGEDGKPVAD